MCMRLLIVALLLSACRDAPEPFVVDNFAATDSLRISFNIGDDRTPAWGARNDTLFYSAQSFPPFALTKGVLLAAPRQQGTVRLILPLVQGGALGQPWLTAPAFSPDGGSIAFFEMTSVASEHCDSLSTFDGPVSRETATSLAILRQAILRVRAVDAAQTSDQAQRIIDFAGRTLDYTRHPAGLDYVIVVNAYPFQARYEADASALFRGSWSPDAKRLVYSDGLQLRLWTIGQSATVALPNTADGVLPAWSPDGTWIAFTKLKRGAEVRSAFVCWRLGSKGMVAWQAYERTTYHSDDQADAELTLIRPDGSALTALGAGLGPAWLPDGRSIIVRRDNHLVRVAVDGGATSAIAHTDFGYEPAVSPDGRWLAFARRVTLDNYDIWLAPLF